MKSGNIKLKWASTTFCIPPNAVLMWSQFRIATYSLLWCEKCSSYATVNRTETRRQSLISLPKNEVLKSNSFISQNFVFPENKVMHLFRNWFYSHACKFNPQVKVDLETLYVLSNNMKTRQWIAKTCHTRSQSSILFLFYSSYLTNWPTAIPYIEEVLYKMYFGSVSWIISFPGAISESQLSTFVS